MYRIVVIGGVAAGMSAASQAKRRRPEAEVVVLERGPYLSYAACGMPYNIEDPGRSIEDLVVVRPEAARQERGLDVRTRHEALAIDVAARTVTVHDLETDLVYDLRYDALVLATGASPIRPALPGFDLPGVFFLRELRHGAALKTYLAQAAPRRAVVVGAGYIGMEMAEVLAARGLNVSVLEKLDQVVPGFEPEIAKIARTELAKHGVAVETGVAVRGIESGADSRLRVLTDRAEHPADLVLVSVGVRPNVKLAQTAGVPLGDTGAIAVDDEMRTGLPGVFAAGDCAEARHLVSGHHVYIPLGTTANKQGKVAGANAAGARERFPGIVGTAAFKLFGIELGRTGLGLAEARALGMEALAATSRHTSRAHGYPGAESITTVLIAEPASGRLLGAQMAGAAVAKRIDVFATALHAGMRVSDIEGLDLSYAPPFAPVYDPVLIAATVAVKAVKAAAKSEQALLAVG